MRIYLVRHVETVGNIERRFNGVTESDYTDYGKYMKEELIKELEAINREDPFDIVYTSPTRRAADTAEALSERIGTDLVVADELKEYNFGIFDGLLVSEARNKDPEMYDKWMNDHLHIKIKEGDSYEEKLSRVSEWIEGVLEKDYKSVVIITHGATLRCLLTTLLELPMEAGWHFDIPLGGYCDIDYSYNYGTLKSMKTPEYTDNRTDNFEKRFIK